MKKFIGSIALLMIILIAFSGLTVFGLSVDDITCIYPGDADGDKITSINDVSQIQKYLVGVISDEDIKVDNFDFNGDGKININDATDIQKKLANMEYDCIVYPDEDFLKVSFGDSLEDFPENFNIEFDTIFCGRDTFYKQINPPKTSSVSLITSPDEYYALINYYSPCFDEDYFKEKALVMAFKESFDWESEYGIKQLAVKDNTLYVGVSYTSPESDVVSPANPTWAIYCSVSKTDITNVNSIVSTYK